MSFEAMAWAVEQKLQSTQKLVLLMLANRINSDTGKCVPSIKRLADDCGLSESCVQRTLKKLESLELIKAHKRHKDNTQLPNQYEITPKPISTPGLPELPPGCTSATPRVAQERTESGRITRNITNTPCKPPRAGKGMTLQAFIEKCRAKGEQAIPPDDPVFSIAEKIGLPGDFVALAWRKFKERYTQGRSASKRYVLWRQVFREAVESNWLKLWWIDRDGVKLTTAGESARRIMQAEEMAGVA